jgi:hypothetical protein
MVTLRRVLAVWPGELCDCRSKRGGRGVVWRLVLSVASSWCCRVRSGPWWRKGHSSPVPWRLAWRVVRSVRLSGFVKGTIQGPERFLHEHGRPPKKHRLFTWNMFGAVAPGSPPPKTDLAGTCQAGGRPVLARAASSAGRVAGAL